MLRTRAGLTPDELVERMRKDIEIALVFDEQQTHRLLRSTFFILLTIPSSPNR